MTVNSSEAVGLVELIEAELHSLHRGRGVQAADLGTRIGKNLRELANAEPANQRQALTVQLNSCAAQLPADMRLAVTASLALSGEIKELPHLDDRVQWLSEQLGREFRTGKRRVSEAERRLAEQIASELQRRRGRVPAAPQGWYLAEMRSLLRLDTPEPESHQFRRIVSTASDLREVMAWVDVPRSDGHSGPALSAEVLHGGRLIKREQPFGNRFQFVVQLPVPLQPGEEHEYALISRVDGGGPMRSHHLMTPECRCDALDVKVRFHPDRPPQWVRCINGETVRMYEEPRKTGDLLVPDPAGEVHAQFSDLVMYLGYGIQWLP
jgi:hypothetical protein